RTHSIKPRIERTRFVRFYSPLVIENPSWKREGFFYATLPFCQLPAPVANPSEAYYKLVRVWLVIR
ncbi:MAG: hypothetical protein ACNA78_07345, partial [Balneolaceae bacterium]